MTGRRNRSHFCGKYEVWSTLLKHVTVSSLVGTVVHMLSSHLTDGQKDQELKVTLGSIVSPVRSAEKQKSKTENHEVAYINL